MSTSIDQLTEDQEVDVRLLAKNCNQVLGAKQIDAAAISTMVLSYVNSLHQMWLPPELQELKAERHKLVEHYEVHNLHHAKQAAQESLQEALATNPDSLEAHERAMLALRGHIDAQHVEAFDRIVGYDAPAPRDDDFSEQAFVQVERQGRKTVVARRAIDSFMNGVRYVGDLITA